MSVQNLFVAKTLLLIYLAFSQCCMTPQHTLTTYTYTFPRLYGLGEAASTIMCLGKEKECSISLLVHMAAYQRVNIIAHEPFHLQQEVKACDYTQQVITEHPAGNLLPFQRVRSKPTKKKGKGGWGRRKEGKIDALSLCMRSVLGPTSEVF